MLKKMTLAKTGKETALLAGLAVLVLVLMAFLAPDSFYTIENFQSMGIQFSEFGIMSFGMMLAMLAGGIDLSLVGIANLSGIVSVLAMRSVSNDGLAILTGIVVALLVGLMCGLWNGFLISTFQIPAMLVTLSSLQLFTGIGLILTKGPALTGVPEAFQLLANGAIFNIPIAVLIFLVVTLSIYYLVHHSVPGRRILFFGTNPTTARYSGINNRRIIMLTYAISGVCGAISGILMTSHYNSAKTDYGSSYTLLTLLIAVLGGISPDGGKGRVFGVSLAIIILQLISSAFNIMRINAFIKTFVWGILLLGTMTAVYLSSHKKSKNRKRG